MTINEFNQLNEMEQAEAIWNGVFIDTREDKNHQILLYQIDEFYVEVYYHKELNVIRDMRTLDCTAVELEPYLRKIDLNGKF